MTGQKIHLKLKDSFRNKLIIYRSGFTEKEREIAKNGHPDCEVVTYSNEDYDAFCKEDIIYSLGLRSTKTTKKIKKSKKPYSATPKTFTPKTRSSAPIA